MSTTVIASRLGALLTIAPFLGPSVDVERLRDVLAGHGLQLPDGEGLARSNEFIAAQGLEPEAAAVLARNLRRIGLHVRTVNDPTIRRSQRVGNASVVNVIAATGLVAGGAAGASAVLGAAAAGPPLAFLVALVLGVVMFLWVAASLVSLNTGGSRLRVAGHAGGSTTQLSDDLRRLEEHLPAHLVASMVERAHTLQAAAQRDPTGPATQELESLKQDVRDILTGDVLEQAESLRDDVQRARRAMAEVRAKGPAQH